MIKEHQDTRQRDNLAKIEEIMRERSDGLTLKQKIDLHLEKVLKKEVISHISDSFFEETEEGGSFYQLRRTNLQRDDGRTLNIVDEIEVEEAKARVAADEEEKKDMNFETFKNQFVDHIEGTAKNEREAHDSADDGEDAKKSIRQGSVSKRGSQLNKTGSQFAGDQDSVEHRNEGLSKRSSKKSNLDASKYQSMSMAKTHGESFKYEIPDSCKVTMMKKVLVQKLSDRDKYFLASHPYPKLEGEMIVFKPHKKDQEKGTDLITYRDYSLRKRLETTPKPPNSEKLSANIKKRGSVNSEDKSDEP